MRIGHLVLPLLSAMGAALAVFLVMKGPAAVDRSIQPAGGNSRWRAPDLPFDHFVAGAGIVEAGGGNIAVGTAVGGIVEQVYVDRGQAIEAGSPLFRIDDRDLQAQLPVLRAQAQQAAASLAQARYQLELATRLQAQHMISDEQFRDRRYQVQADEAALAAARAQVGRLRVDIERCIVRAPIAGRVLQLNVRAGEYAQAGATSAPLMVVGDDEHMRVRVDIDEYDAQRIVPDAPAIAVVRDEPKLKATLHFANVEPYVIPRQALTGDVTERVDTRVLQVLYTFDRSALPVYVGQHLDVYIRSSSGG